MADVTTNLDDGERYQLPEDADDTAAGELGPASMKCAQSAGTCSIFCFRICVLYGKVRQEEASAGRSMHISQQGILLLWPCRTKHNSISMTRSFQHGDVKKQHQAHVLSCQELDEPLLQLLMLANMMFQADNLWHASHRQLLPCLQGRQVPSDDDVQGPDL